MTASYVKPCRERLEALLEEGGIEAAVLCTADGLAVAHAGKAGESERVAAMSASMLALGDAMIGGGDGEAAECRQVVVETDGRVMTLIHAGENMALAVTGAADVTLGMVLGRARRAAEDIVTIVAESSDAAAIEEHARPERADLEELVRRVLREAAEARGG